MILTDIIDALKGAGIDAYLPGKHDGKCTTAYAVVADDGVRRAGKTTGRRMYVVTAFVPAARPTDMNGLLADIRQALKSLDNLRETDGQSADWLDGEIDGYCTALTYSALCSLI